MKTAHVDVYTHCPYCEEWGSVIVATMEEEVAFITDGSKDKVNFVCLECETEFELILQRVEIKVKEKQK